MGVSKYREGKGDQNFDLNMGTNCEVRRVKIRNMHFIY